VLGPLQNAGDDNRSVFLPQHLKRLGISGRRNPEIAADLAAVAIKSRQLPMPDTA
jgi:hypothetical protein